MAKTTREMVFKCDFGECPKPAVRILETEAESVNEKIDVHLCNGHYDSWKNTSQKEVNKILHNIIGD